MRRLRYIMLTVVLVLVAGASVNAQIVVEENIDQPVAAASSWDKNIAIHADPRLAILVEKHKNQQSGGIRHMRGYRVQIYYGVDRNIAFSRKADFMRRYPGTKVYMVYTQPQYRVKVGDFATREDAGDLYREMISIYGACMIVPDYVTINTLKDD